MVNVTFTIIPIPLFLSSIIPSREIHDLNLGIMPAALQVPASLLVPGIKPSHHFLHAINDALVDMLTDNTGHVNLPTSIINIDENVGEQPFQTTELDVSPQFLESVTDFLSYLVSSKFYNTTLPEGMVLPPGVKILPPELIEEAALSAFIGPPPRLDSVYDAPDSLFRKVEYPYYVEKQTASDPPALPPRTSFSRPEVRSDDASVAAWDDYYAKLKEYNDFYYPPYQRSARALDNNRNANRGADPNKPDRSDN